MTDLARTALRTVGGLVGAGVAGVAYAALVERTWFTLRRYAVPALPPGSAPVRILQVSDLHLTPGQSKKIEWVRSLAELEPDFVVNSGDNLAHVDAVPPLLRAMEPLLERPGAFVLGSNDYFAPVLKNPARYLTKKHAEVKSYRADLPVERLVEGLREGGWADLNNARDGRLDGRPRRRAGGRQRPPRRLRPLPLGVRAGGHRRHPDHGAGPRPLPAGARRHGGRRRLRGAGRAHPRRPARPAGCGGPW